MFRLPPDIPSMPSLTPTGDIVVKAELTNRGMEAVRIMMRKEIREALAVSLPAEDLCRALAGYHRLLGEDCGQFELDADWRVRRDALQKEAARLLGLEGYH